MGKSLLWSICHIVWWVVSSTNTLFKLLTPTNNNNLTPRSISSGALFLLYGHPQVCPVVIELQTEIFIRDHCCPFSGEDKLSRLIQ